MKEVWKPVPYKPYDLKYLVSNTGRVKPAKKSKFSSAKGECLRPGIGARGYGCVTLYHNGVHKQCFVHRMVALAFIGKPPAGKNQVLHLDDNKLNNVSSNLVWGDHFDNMRHKVEHGRSVVANLVGSKHPLAKLDEDRVKGMRRDYERGYTQKELSQMYGVTQNVVSRIVNWKSWKHIDM